MNYAYLDHNIIDRIDSGLLHEVTKFLSDNAFIPVVSTTSLTEIERCGRPERVIANIQSLMTMGARFMLDSDSESEMILAQLSTEKIYEILSRKNQTIADIIKFLSAAQFYKFSCRSKRELEASLGGVIEEIRPLIDKLDKKHEKTAGDLYTLIEILNNLIKEDMPDEFNFINDLRSKLAVNSKELNNLEPAELWEKIEKLFGENRRLIIWWPLEGSIKYRLYHALLMLNTIGYWCDSIDSEKRQLAFNYDCMHGFYGCFCGGVISSDKRFLKRLKAAYYYLSIQTKIFHFTRNRLEKLN